MQMLQRNNQSRFSQLPQLEAKRSTFKRPTSLKTTFNAGDLIPVFVDPTILPGDTVNMDMSFVVRQTTPIHPVMDNANVEYFWFFVPHRLVYDDFEHFITGGLDAGEWDTPTEYPHPMVRPVVYDATISQDRYIGFPFKSLGDYMGIPVGFSDDFTRNCNHKAGFNALPFRAYAKIWNDWFRSSGLQKEILIPKTGGRVNKVVGEISSVVRPANTGNVEFRSGNYISTLPDTTCYGGSLLKANKYHDFFTSALPEPQRGEPVGVPLEGSLPVTTGDVWSEAFSVGTVHAPMQMATLQNVTQVTDDGSSVQINNSTGALQVDGTNFNSWATPSNLIVNADGVGNLQISINDLRHALAVQHILELDARGGNRYTEIIFSHFNVSSPDARLQRSEYLGGTSVPVNMEQVLQTSATNDVSPQGNTAAFSLTAGTDGSFTKSFTEHGTLMCLMCVRHVRTYQQGLAKKWTPTDRYSYYWPALNGISEQAILNKEIYMSGDDTLDNEVFGYQEAWAEYRYFPSTVTGAMRSDYPQSLDVWHYADHYSSTPHLSPDWIQEGAEEIDRTISVSSSVEDQFIADLYFDSTWYRVMPVYSVPGLDRL